MFDSCKGTLVAAAGPVWNPMYNSQFFVSVSAGDIWLLCLYLLFMIAVLTHVFWGRGEKKFEIKMFRNYFMLLGYVFQSLFHFIWLLTPHTILPRVRWPTPGDWGTLWPQPSRDHPELVLSELEVWKNSESDGCHSKLPFPSLGSAGEFQRAFWGQVPMALGSSGVGLCLGRAHTLS